VGSHRAALDTRLEAYTLRCARDPKVTLLSEVAIL
jgi:hypothetical protein